MFGDYTTIVCWTPVAQALDADYDVIVVDVRGCDQAVRGELGPRAGPEPSAQSSSVLQALTHVTGL